MNSKPKIRDYKGDLSKRWAVYYYEGGLRKIIWISEKIKNKKERYAEANRIKEEIISKLSGVIIPDPDEITKLRRLIKSKDNEIANLKRQLAEVSRVNQEIQLDHRTKILVDQVRTTTGANVIENLNVNQFFFVNNVQNNVTVNSLINRKLLTDAINEALEFKKAFVAKRTYYDYKQVVKKFLGWVIKNHPGIAYNEFTSYMANQYVQQTYTKRRYSAKTVNVNVGYLSTHFKRISEVYPLEKNPFKIQSLRENQPDINYWDTPDKTKLFDYLKSNEPEMFIIVLMVYQCFLRPNEIRQIQVKDINLNRGTIKVNSLNGKSNSGKHSTMSKQIIELLTPIVENNNSKFYVFSKGLKPGKYPISRNTISTRFKTIREKLKIPEDFKLYNFKHTGNSELLEKGLNIRDLQLQNGHSDINMTERYIRRINNIGNAKIVGAWENI